MTEKIKNKGNMKTWLKNEEIKEIRRLDWKMKNKGNKKNWAENEETKKIKIFR